MQYPKTLSVKVAKAINHGIPYILQKRETNGLWHDFKTLAGSSNEWVSAYVLNGLAQVSHYQSELGNTHKTLLMHQRKNGGWGYNEFVPSDADSTAWTLLSFHALPFWRPSAILKGLQYLELHIDKASGAFTTYSERDQIDHYINATPEAVKGWTAPHACVTALALQCMIAYHQPDKIKLIRKACRYLLAQQSESGLWESYWWQGNAYCSFQSLKALLQVKAISNRAAKKAYDQILDLQHPEGYWTSGSDSPDNFATAFYLRTLLLDEGQRHRTAVQYASEYLVRQQQKNGSWKSAPILRIPMPMTTVPGNVSDWKINKLGTGVIISDQQQIFTTTSVICALHRALESQFI